MCHYERSESVGASPWERVRGSGISTTYLHVRSIVSTTSIRTSLYPPPPPPPLLPANFSSGIALKGTKLYPPKDAWSMV